MNSFPKRLAAAAVALLMTAQAPFAQDVPYFRWDVGRSSATPETDSFSFEARMPSTARVGTPLLGLLVANAPANYEVVGAAPATLGMSLVSQEPAAAVVGVTPTVAGAYRVTFKATKSAGGAVRTRDVLLQVLPADGTVQPSLVANLPDGVVGVQYSGLIYATNADETGVDVTGLPPGLSRSQAGSVGSMPTTPGTYQVTASLPGFPDVRGNYTVRILPSPDALAIDVSQVPTSLVAGAPAPGGARVSATGRGPFAFSATNLPAGLSLDAATGAISGAPASATEAPVQVTFAVRRAVDDGNSDSRSVSMQVAPPPPSGGGRLKVSNYQSTYTAVADPSYAEYFGDYGFWDVTVEGAQTPANPVLVFAPDAQVPAGCRGVSSCPEFELAWEKNEYSDSGYVKIYNRVPGDHVVKLQMATATGGVITSDPYPVKVEATRGNGMEHVVSGVPSTVRIQRTAPFSGLLFVPPLATNEEAVPATVTVEVESGPDPAGLLRIGNSFYNDAIVNAEVEAPMFMDLILVPTPSTPTGTYRFRLVATEKGKPQPRVARSRLVEVTVLEALPLSVAAVAMPSSQNLPPPTPGDLMTD